MSVTLLIGNLFLNPFYVLPLFKFRLELNISDLRVLFSDGFIYLLILKTKGSEEMTGKLDVHYKCTSMYVPVQIAGLCSQLPQP